MKRWPAVITALCALTCIALAQRGRRSLSLTQDEADNVMPARPGEFHFLRLEYTDLPQYHRNFGYSSRDGIGTGWWLMDWPAAENHFTTGLERLTRIQAGDPRHVRLTDEALFDYPWIYATQTGWWNLSDTETSRLREYLLRGGFLVTDDFWGEDQWQIFRDTMNRVFPGQPISDLPHSDPLLHVLYDIEEKDLTFIPGSRHLRRGPGGTIQIVRPEGTNPAWRALHDDKGRVMVAANFNTDTADAWEFADVPYYPEKMTALAYRYGINYVVYAMTH